MKPGLSQHEYGVIWLSIKHHLKYTGAQMFISFESEIKEILMDDRMQSV